VIARFCLKIDLKTVLASCHKIVVKLENCLTIVLRSSVNLGPGELTYLLTSVMRDLKTVVNVL